MTNSGFKILGDLDYSEEKVQYIVVGVGRGGTSSIAASLHAIGISQGAEFHPANYEDYAMSKAFRSRDWKKFKTLINEYETKYQKFAWKLPDSHLQLNRVYKYFSNPYFIFVYRDIFAIGNRKNISVGSELFSTMGNALSAYNRVIKFNKKHNPRALHVSYEKLLLHKEAYAEELIKFCNVENTQILKEKIISIIEPQPLEYLNWTKAVKENNNLKSYGIEGAIDRISHTHISGWICLLTSDEPLNVELYINEKKIKKVVCNEYRADLIVAKKSSSGKAGFNISLEGIAIKDGDRIMLNPEDYNCSLSKVYTSK
jgi:hypothetical protein